jgi:hypothetical protein
MDRPTNANLKTYIEVLLKLYLALFSNVYTVCEFRDEINFDMYSFVPCRNWKDAMYTMLYESVSQLTM